MRNGKTRLTVGIYAMMFASAVCTSAQGALLSDLIAGYRLESSSQGFMSAAQSIGNLCAGLTGCAEGVVLPMSLDIACGWEEDKTYLGSTMLLFAHYTGFIVSAPVVAYLIARFGIKPGMFLPAGLSLAAAFLARGLIPFDRILQGGNHAERSGDF